MFNKLGKQKAWVVTRKDGTEEVYFNEKEFIKATFDGDYSHSKIEKRNKKDEVKKEQQEKSNEPQNKELLKEILMEKCEKAKNIEDLKQILKKIVEVM